MSDTRVSAVMTSTETDSGHSIQRWGHRRWSHGERPDPDATMTAEAIEQRPGVPVRQPDQPRPRTSTHGWGDGVAGARGAGFLGVVEVHGFL